MSGGNGGIDPSTLHLKKELSQILKATRVLRDPGTSSAPRSPLYSARALTKIHYVNMQQKNGSIDGNVVVTPSQKFLHLPFQPNSTNGNGNCSSSSSGYYDKSNVKGKEKRVFLCNWRDGGRDGFEDSTTDEGLSGDARNGGGRFGDMSIIRRGGVKKSKSDCRSHDSLKQHEHKKIVLSRWNSSSKGGAGSDGLRLGRKKLVTLVDESDYTEDSGDMESLRRESVVSSLLSGRKNKSLARSPMKLRGCGVEGDLDSYNTEVFSKRSNNEYRMRNVSAGSANEADDDDDDQLDFPVSQGCGIPCNWPNKSMLKSRLAYGNCFSPSVSDTLRRKQLYGRRHHGLSSRSNTRKAMSRTVPQSHVPLLYNSDDENDLDEVVHDQEGSAGSLSEKYRPAFFDEVIGQDTVLQSLVGAVSKGKISPIHLFYGPRGTGKSSTARIFAAALNCLAAKESKPCMMCRECVNFVSHEKIKYLVEIDSSNKKGVSDISSVLKNFLVVHPYDRHRYKTIVVDECHLLPSKAWLMFLQLVEKPLPPGVVFVFVTTDVDSVPHAILFNCQKHLFDEISIPDIVTKLRKIAGDENLDVESDAFKLIASNAAGSLRDAETMLDQLSLFGRRITASMVNDLLGAVSDDKVLELLDLAMSSNANETVIKPRELMGSGVDPIVLTSQMASLIDPTNKRSVFGGRSLSESEKEKLRNVLKIISEAQKHLSVSSQPSAWFMAILLQLGSLGSTDQTSSSNDHHLSFKATEDDNRSKACVPAEMAGSTTSCAMATGRNSTSKVNQVSQTKVADFSSDSYKRRSKALQDIWDTCIEKCYSKTLGMLLQSHGKLVSISETKAGRYIAHVAFKDENARTQAEAFLSSITRSFEVILRHKVEVRITLLPDTASRISTDNNTAANLEGRSTCLDLDILMRGSECVNEQSALPRQSFRVCGSPQIKPLGSTYRNINTSTSKRNDLPTISLDKLSLHQEENVYVDITALKIEDGTASQKDRLTNRTDHIPVSPSLSRNPNMARGLSKDIGYEFGSGFGCTGFLCWRRTPSHRKVKVKQGKSTRVRTRRRISWFGECAKSRRMNK